jgi:hypothetical protein
MNSVLNLFDNFNAAFFWTVASVAVLGGITMLLVFLVGRCALREHRIRRYDELALKIHNQ